MYNSDGSINSALQKNRKFYVTALIIPKQESTSDSVWQFHHGLSSAIAYCFCYYFSLTVVECITFNQCQTTNEEEIFEVQDKRSLFPLGWIHVSNYGLTTPFFFPLFLLLLLLL
jgi:STAM-binding protein